MWITELLMTGWRQVITYTFWARAKSAKIDLNSPCWCCTATKSNVLVTPTKCNCSFLIGYYHQHQFLDVVGRFSLPPVNRLSYCSGIAHWNHTARLLSASKYSVAIEIVFWWCCMPLKLKSPRLHSACTAWNCSMSIYYLLQHNWSDSGGWAPLASKLSSRTSLNSKLKSL